MPSKNQQKIAELEKLLQKLKAKGKGKEVKSNRVKGKEKEAGTKRGAKKTDTTPKLKATRKEFKQPVKPKMKPAPKKKELPSTGGGRKMGVKEVIKAVAQPKKYAVKEIGKKIDKKITDTKEKITKGKLGRYMQDSVGPHKKKK